MKRFQKTRTPWVYVVIGVGMPALLITDIYSPLGVVDWIFYFLLIVGSYFTWRPLAPVTLAGVTTVFLVLGYFLSPPGEDPVTSRLNRTFGVITAWSLAVVGYQFVRNRIMVRQQEWLQNGRTVLSERILGELGLQELGERVLSFLVEYLQAQVGAIFMREGGRYQRFAVHGVAAGARVPETFQPGETLLGEVAKSQRPLVVTQVPEGYLAVGSGLGQAVPRNLLISPLIVDHEVNGVLELGFFQGITESDQALVGRVSEAVAVAVRSAQYRTRLQELLEETQRQAEELQAQSEELRVNNEELEEQSRALKESQTRLELQQAELEQTNTHLEEQAQALALQKAELLQTKGRLEEQARELQQASSYKSAFLANMSHELRTPLNSSLILAKLLADNRPGNLNEEQVKYAKMIESAGNDLLLLINDVLDLAKIEAGHMQVNAHSFRLAGLVESLQNTFAPLAQQKGLRLQMQVAPDAPEMLSQDAQRLEQVLRNLLSNAIKFTESGEVALEVASESNGQIAFKVRDTGPGIAPDQQRLIFEPFCQGDGSTSRKHGGTGLGLSISREFARLMGGEIYLVSAPGAGSTFSVVLPPKYEPSAPAARRAELAPAVSPGTPATVPAAMPPVAAARTGSVHAVEDDRAKLVGTTRTILIVEDDESFASILCTLARELGFQCLIATSSTEALAMAAQYSPSAVLLDIGLPDSSGLSVLDRLKMDARTRHVPVYVVSGRDYSQTALAMGAVGYMLKPVKREQLVEAFEKLETRLTQKLRRVLIVEDDPLQMESIRQLLGSADVEPVGVHSAAECLERLRGSTFDCMVLDLSLPDASGFALLDTLSREDQYSFPPVIVYTGRELSTEEEQLLRKYSKSIIIKGAKSPERLLDEITLFLHQVVTELPPEQQKMLEKARSRDAALEGRHVLIVEDDVRNVFALTSVFEPQGTKVQIARNGREALEALDRAAQGSGAPVDLVLMDLMMPEMDGLTAMREIRKRPEWARLPIIALTAKAMKDDQEQSLAAGANDYMAKPLDVEKLLSLVRVWMPR